MLGNEQSRKQARCRVEGREGTHPGLSGGPSPVSDESHWAESKGKRTTFPSGVSPGNPGHRDLPEALPWGGDEGAWGMVTSAPGQNIIYIYIYIFI